MLPHLKPSAVEHINRPDPTAYSQVIAVDLDGTLVLTDTLHESVLLILKQAFFTILKFPLWLLQGKVAFKSKISERVSLNATLLPYNKALIDWLIQQRASGKKIVLTTAADQSIANAVAQHVGLFDEVLASDGTFNNASSNKSLLSFPIEGYTLALDFKFSQSTIALLHRLDDMVAGMGGRVYLTKDAVMRELSFKTTYPRWQEFESVRQKYGAIGKFASAQSKRLGLA